MAGIIFYAINRVGGLEQTLVKVTDTAAKAKLMALMKQSDSYVAGTPNDRNPFK